MPFLPPAVLPFVSFWQPRRLPLVRWTCLIGLLVAELLGLTFRFDTETLPTGSGGWAEWLGHSHVVARLAVVIAAATWVLGGARLRTEFHRHATALTRSGRWVLFLVVHLASFAMFTWLTAFVMEGGAAASGHFGAWAAVWAALGLAVIVSWCAAAVPPTLWLSLGKRAAVWLAIGLVVGVAAWMASRWTGELWRPFREGTFWLVRGLLSATGADIVCEPDQSLLGTTAFAVRIAPECSGYEGMGLVAVFLGGYLWLFRHRLRFPAALLLLPIGVAAMWLLNAVRIAALVLIGSWGSPEVARGGFHSQAGWLAFNAVALGLVALSGRLRFVQTEGPAARASRSPTTAYLAPFCAVVATMMLTRAVSGGFDKLYPVRVLAAVAILWCFRRQYDWLSEGWSWSAPFWGVLAFLLWVPLTPVPANPATGPATAAAAAGLSSAGVVCWLIFRVLGAVITVPVVEELAFRGYLLRRLRSAEFEKVDPRAFSWFGFLASSALFAVLHASWLAGLATGMIYAWAYCRRGRLMDAVLAHATTNALLAIYVAATGQWALWG